MTAKFSNKFNSTKCFYSCSANSKHFHHMSKYVHKIPNFLVALKAAGEIFFDDESYITQGGTGLVDLVIAGLSLLSINRN